MRIAYVTADPGVPVFGCKGCSIHVQEVLRAMARFGAQVHLFASNTEGREEGAPLGVSTVPPRATGRGCEMPDRDGIRLHAVLPSPKGDPAQREQQCLAANPALRAALEAEGPFNMVYERYSLWSFAAMEYARDTATPGLLEVNAPLIDEHAEHRGLVDRRSAQRVAERAFSAASALAAVSDEVAEYLGRFPGARAKTRVIPNGVNAERFSADVTASLPAAPGTFTVGFAGSMKPWHGLPNLLDAFARLHERCPQTRLLLVGDGVARERLAAEAAARGLSRAVHFTGAVSHAEVPGLLASMDAAVAPYPNLPNFYFSPLKVYEYMAAALPVVASRVGQLEQLLQSGVDGLLVPPGDARALAEALERLQRDGALRLRLGQAARLKVLRHHTWDRAVLSLFALAGLKSPARPGFEIPAVIAPETRGTGAPHHSPST